MALAGVLSSLASLRRRFLDRSTDLFWCILYIQGAVVLFSFGGLNPTI
jgi:hypothetical protein